MLGLFNLFARPQRTKAHSTPRRPTRLWLEQLETRDCPSTTGSDWLIVSSSSSGASQSSSTTVPVIALSATMNGLQSVTLSGSVTDPAASATRLTVIFTGAVNTTTTTDANGLFSLTINASALGTVQASTVDSLGQSSNTAIATIACATPDIENLTCVDNAGVVTVSGQVIHPDAAGMAVTLQGAPASLQNGVTVIAASDGTFSYTFTAASGDQGLITASCTDVWGQQSGDPSVLLEGGNVSVTTAPLITLSVTMNGLKSVTLSGTVVAENSAGLTVTFTGVVNSTTTTDSAGHFSLTINASALGNVMASTVDGLGETSNTATATVACAAPVISGFIYDDEVGVADFSGVVTAADAVGMTVTIQGTPAPLQNGVTTTAGAGGEFDYFISLTATQTGTVQASCVDCWGQASNVEFTYVG